LAVCSRLIAMTRVQRAALGPMHEGRVDVIGGGAIVVEELAAALGKRAGIDELVVSEHDILDGIALSIP
ncbi:MAG: exopolyphosphatase / guanosine-5-triphosphate,3-diphosphate pyrophosphatase, partial [Actinomycetota bacterium]|nr:exopolyphosphatase / guanosine-5-triphosphate,3-diphosphate pyrophosphatase [Actinomycetota bacterium]